MKAILTLTLLIAGLSAGNFEDNKKACDGGDMGSCYSLAGTYNYGNAKIKVKQDKRKAAEFYKKACDGGVVLGCYYLGNLYKDGKGVRQDKRKAKELYGKACDGGDMSGCNSYRILNEAGVQ